MRHDFSHVGLQELRQKVEAERQANMEAGMKVKELEQLLKIERMSFTHQLADATKAVRNSFTLIGNHSTHKDIVRGKASPF